jgi:hypothetical protein
MPIPPVGNVVTPTNFLAMSAQAQVLLSWAPSPLVNLYYVNRSTDNITFANIASTVSLNYNDTTGIVDVIYYYQVQASNGVNSSQPSTSLAALSLNPGEETVGNIRLECQQRTDHVEDDNITDQEWNSMISKSYKELKDILIQKFGNEYAVAAPYTFSTVQNQGLYPLPNDFYKLLLCEVSLNINDPNAYITLSQYEFLQKNLYNYPNQFTMYGVTNLHYRLLGDNISIVPLPMAAQTIRLWYVPRANQLINDTDILDGISGYEEYIVADVCIKALAKTEEDASVYGAQKMALLKRIEEAAENRNIAEPQKVTDSRRKNFSWTSGGTGDFGGGFY